ncbi:MAG: hypothetical protein IJJ41_08605 [Clostridia bacterium]|nr:hypothetical protein [Clostridia bacterium]
MSITGRLLSAALTAGATLAVGYGIKKLSEKLENPMAVPEQEPEREIIGTADAKISLKIGDSSDWSYTMKQKGVVKESENKKESGVHRFDFVPLKDGVTELEFDYKPRSAAAAQQTITYNIEVKNGNIIRCDAAGDLQMLHKQ